MQEIFISQDFTEDVGDLTALYCAGALHNKGAVNLLGVSCGTSYPKGPGAISACLTYLGIDVPIGTWKGASMLPLGQPWVEGLYDGFDRNGVGLADTVEDSMITMRRALAESEGRVILFELGPINAIAALLQTPADSISSLTGSELVAAKCKYLSAMGGTHNGSGEWNWIQDPASADYVFRNWPTDVPIIFFPHNVGEAVTVGSQIQTRTEGDILRFGQFLHGSTSGQDGWDETTIIAAVTGFAGYTLTRGYNRMRTSGSTVTAFNDFLKNSTGPHYMAQLSQSGSYYAAQVDEILMSYPDDDPYLPDWGAAAPILTIMA